MLQIFAVNPHKRIRNSVSKKVSYKNGVNPSFYRPSNTQVELGIDFIARNDHLITFYIFGGSAKKKLVLWDVTDRKEIWYI